MSRFRRTKDELSRGLTPSQAQEERKAAAAAWTPDEIAKLAKIVMPPMTPAAAQKAYDEADPIPLKKKDIDKAVKLIKAKENGEFFISIFPAKGVDKDYFEHIKARVEVTLDNDFYKWVDHYLDKVYGGDASKLFQDILDKGIGEVINTVHLEKDIKGRHPAG